MKIGGNKGVKMCAPKSEGGGTCFVAENPGILQNPNSI